MEAQKVYEGLKVNEIIKGMEVVFHTQPNGIAQIRVGFGQAGTEQVQQASVLLEEMGFKVSLFGAMKRFVPETPSFKEKYDAMSPEQQKAATDLWEKMVRS